MAIKIKSEEQRKLEKEAKKPKTKLQKGRLALLILTIIVSIILFFYFILCFNPLLYIIPVFFLWMAVVLIPSIVTVGFIWLNDGYNKVASTVTSWLVASGEALPKIIEALQASLPYVGGISLGVIAGYIVLSLLTYLKDKNNKNLAHLIISSVIFILYVLFFVLSLIFINKIEVK